ncbi:MAG: ABC superfamily ATP binding cassette transporter [Parcubacteria group bacterium GW2011_GWC2_39_14]|nr:MAG: ABC superfamily ATP binding cassette transporter [Parcubacteria group bacterium GW2011_GWC2_39_14]KKR54513.1 MAG: ABC superfamily ATP binding cassette transporter [Parcubacteria group bacterium GW2011_GWA2_40_23]
MLQVRDLSKDFPGQTVLHKVSFSINPQEKIALVGANGVGKSTLLKIIAGLDIADSGEINKSSDFKIAYLPQELKLNLKQTILDYVKTVTDFTEIEANMKRLEQDLSDDLKITEYNNLQEQYKRKQGHSFRARLEIMLKGVGLFDLNPERQINSLSGGQKTKVALIGVLMQEADLLLLDEPTNNLDLPAIIWLEMFLQKTKASVMIISHDQRFLDKVADRVIALDWYTHQAEVFSGSYSEYLEYMQKKIAKEKQAVRLQQDKIKQVIESSEQLKQWAQKGAQQAPHDNDKYIRGAQRNRSSGLAKKAKASEKKITRMADMKVTRKRVPLSIPLDVEFDKAKPTITLSQVVAGYNGQPIIGPINLQIGYGSRVGVVGLNGQGKTTLLKVITQDLKPISGEVHVSPGLHAGNLMQEHENLDLEITIFDFVVAKTGLPTKEIYHLLDVFNFVPKLADKLISTLSPGERARLIFLLFAAKSVNALILDEPSNHLDLEALTALEEVLLTYQGTVVIVSHDRYLLSKIKLTHLYLLTDGRLQLLPDFDLYLLNLQKQSQNLLNKININ